MEVSTIVCQNCQTPNPAKNLYCQSCGKPLTQAALPVLPSIPSSSEPSPQVSSFEEAVPSSQKSASTPVFPMPVQEPPQTQLPGPGWQGTHSDDSQPQVYRPQEMPPQQPAYYPPPPVPPSAPLAQTLESLGSWKDGWADLIAGDAEKAMEIEIKFVENMKARDIPLAMVEKVELGNKITKKNYLVVRNPHGVVAVQIGAIGNDLSLSWSLYSKHLPNWRMIAILAGIAFGVSFLNALGTFNFGIFFVNWVFGTFSWLLPTAILALIAGYVWKGSFWYFLLENPGEMANEELVALTIAVHQSLLAAIDKVGIDVDKLRRKVMFTVGNDKHQI